MSAIYLLSFIVYSFYYITSFLNEVRNMTFSVTIRTNCQQLHTLLAKQDIFASKSFNSPPLPRQVQGRGDR